MNPKVLERNARWFPDFVPAHEIYLQRAEALAPAGARILHLGAGRDALGVVARLVGRDVVAVDPDRSGLQLNAARQKVVASGESLPFADGSFDMILCEHVFEHLENPGGVLAECGRVLRGGGSLLFLTPNRFGYVAIVAALTPYKFHVWYKGLMVDTATIDTFPTFYRINTGRRISQLGRRAGFSLVDLQTFVGWPTYLEHSQIAHLAGLAIHKALEWGPRAFHLSLVGTLKKQSRM